MYYSSTGTNHQLAKWAAESAEAEGAQVKVFRTAETAPDEAVASNPAWQAHLEATKDIQEVTLDDLEWADAIIFSSPTRFGNIPAQMKQFLDTTGGLWFEGKLANKVVSGMSSASNAHGGQEKTLQTIYTTMMHWGAFIVPPGYTDMSLFEAGGNPYGVSVTVDQDGNMIENVEAAVKHQAKRTITVASWVKDGQAQA
ncbi:NAD(P)H:quinone oxidoreductase [Salsuginibacillus halophilus]|uniref:NAD(P)H:quinone oxidoreductase n=1 Tax=Salsuginibacillus halophilus TaxID=517424 RepID=UPI001FE52AE7|nr:NAD(P)H:quinone oxidoreductase [Salsuginibacillus halophilus]